MTQILGIHADFLFLFKKKIRENLFKSASSAFH